MHCFITVTVRLKIFLLPCAIQLKELLNCSDLLRLKCFNKPLIQNGILESSISVSYSLRMHYINGLSNIHQRLLLTRNITCKSNYKRITVGKEVNYYLFYIFRAPVFSSMYRSVDPQPFSFLKVKSSNYTE